MEAGEPEAAEGASVLQAVLHHVEHLQHRRRRMLRRRAHHEAHRVHHTHRVHRGDMKYCFPFPSAKPRRSIDLSPPHPPGFHLSHPRELSERQGCRLYVEFKSEAEASTLSMFYKKHLIRNIGAFFGN